MSSWSTEDIGPLREALGLTQTEFGALLRVNAVAVNQWEVAEPRELPDTFEQALDSLYESLSETQRQIYITGALPPLHS
ncbi:helix-turn-helix domain-containing protein [Kineosporia succinea]|uniref:DNA-binding transcriptional regulator YiaG n=1 Tax=Kineosporia succinea TaxID=84632 RepID=A0ABT9PAX7_9ACTN|nr:hypothetical protein [Kineosporia succinea]MDP9829851.1 DNA-binding transcriptional regulator YiaG [Kineosporia succinea]